MPTQFVSIRLAIGDSLNTKEQSENWTYMAQSGSVSEKTGLRLDHKLLKTCTHRHSSYGSTVNEKGTGK